MKTHRHLDSLLDSVREHPPVERLVRREDVMAMLDAEGRAGTGSGAGSGASADVGADAVTAALRRRSRAVLVTTSLVVAVGLALVGGWALFGGGDDPRTPRAPATAEAGQLSRTAGSDREAPAASGADAGPTAGGASTDASGSAGGSSDSRHTSATTSSASDGGHGGPTRIRRGARSGESTFFMADKVAFYADGSMVLNPPDAQPDAQPEARPNEKPDEKPALPSGGITISKTQLDSAEAAAIAARDAAGEALDIKRLGYIELTADEAARLGITVSDDGLSLMADDRKDAQIRSSDSDDRNSLYGSRKGGDVLKELERGDSQFLVRFKLEVVRESTRFAAVEVDVDAAPLPIAPIVIVNQRRWDLRNEGSSLIFFRNAPTLAGYEGDAILRDEPLEAFRSATRSIASIDGINRAMSHALGRLVPVYFRFDDGVIEGTNIRRGADICLWYAPTKQFIDALPHRYRASLESELSAICEVQEKNGSVDEACDRIAGRPSYLELCRVSSGAVNAAMASPNPADERTTISFRLSESRAVSVTLHDVNGRYLRHLLHQEERSTGEQRIEADLDGVGQGAYLVAVRTDRGEQAVARLIVQ